jgi:hypothetical protein
VAEQPDPVATLTGEIKAHTPPEWQLRVRWRDEQLTASITPLPYQVAFELWYDLPRLIETLTGLCPGPDKEIWTLIKAEQDVVLEPTVGGKTGVEARVSCRKVTTVR